MKKQFLTVLLVAFIGLFSANAQTEVGGVKLAQKVTMEDQSLVLNGAGVREKFFMDMYVGALYLPKKNANAADIMGGNDAAAIKLTIVSGMITSDKMINAVNEGFENATGGNTAPIKAKIAQFKAFFKEEIKKGDVFDLVYVPNKGVVVSKNGKEKGVIEGAEFKKAMFGIWLSNKPADKGLKAAMLGK
ncbi:chalcone isomerase family protein [Flavobacterium sp.]|uniref:chalcone isomerase family protein n=1 Tax=Flavobacterium sp. TaxID=239 RepID=UPI0028BEA66A|nr:chalcone isomerase family protein [Flavobacterium sp.]